MKTKPTKNINEEFNKYSKDELVRLCITLKGQLEETNDRMENMLEQIRLAQHKRFGSSSEKYKLSEGYEQIGIYFNEAEHTANEELEEPEYEEVVKKVRRKKSKGKRESDLSNFPVVVINHKIPEEELKCKECEGVLSEMVTETYKVLKFIPAHFEVEEHVVQVYSCDDCETVVRADRPQTLLRGSIATPSLVASIMNAKYVNALPLNRQEEEFKRYNVNISRQTMANWMIRCAEEYLYLIYCRLKKSLLMTSHIQADETRVTVLKEDGRKPGTESWMWVYRTGELLIKKPVILFEYQKTRAMYHPKEFLSGYIGNLTTDGYSAYKDLPYEINVSGCWAHLRRKFLDCIKGLSKSLQKGTVANEALKRIGLLYKIEEVLSEKTADERLKERSVQSKPIVDSFYEWVYKTSAAVPGNSLIAKAFTYAKNQKEYLYKFLSDGLIPIDNNATERAIRPFAIGRGNWLFCATPKGAEASAIIYSIVETAKANNLKPYDYLTHLLSEIPKHYTGTSQDFIDKLLPWSDDIPSNCKKSL
ncbi:MAG: IS66 family transposase [Candidatus Delongbacteria bacterium]|nr:IS66 family transposase [Candidatus Delongbacteria bacterium]